MKEEHRLLADFSHLFTAQFLDLARKSLQDRSFEKPSFMNKLPGVFEHSKKGLSYTDSDGLKRYIVPKENRERFIKALWRVPTVPRGQESFQRFIAKRYIGIQARFIREFVGNQTGLQFIRPLKNTDKNRRAVRSTEPFKRISFDLKDCISFSDVRGEDEPRFVLLVCCDFSGYLLGLLLNDKSGPEVAQKMKQILKRINQIGGKPIIGTSDLGKEFLNKHVQALFKSNNIRHLQPKTARIAPFIENRVRHFSKYLRILSKLLFKDTKWFEPETIRNACESVNNITRKSGYSAKEIVKLWQKGKSLAAIKESYERDEAHEDKTVGFGKLEKGDFVRLRVAKQKLDLKHKTHLGFEADYFVKPVNWSVEVYRVLETKRYRVRRTTRFKLNNKQWYNRQDLLKIPSNKTYDPNKRMSRVNRQNIVAPQKVPEKIVPKKTDKKIKLDIDTSNIITGRRRRKRINYGE